MKGTNRLRALEDGIVRAWDAAHRAGELPRAGALGLAEKLLDAAQRADEEYEAFQPVIRQHLVVDCGLRGKPIQDAVGRLEEAAGRAWLQSKLGGQ